MFKLNHLLCKEEGYGADVRGGFSIRGNPEASRLRHKIQRLEEKLSLNQQSLAAIEAEKQKLEATKQELQLQIEKFKAAIA